MTPADVSGITQTLLSPSTTTSNPSLKGGNGANLPDAATTLTKENKSVPADTVSLSQQSLQTLTEAKKEAVKKEDTPTASGNARSDKAEAKVQFVYNMKGELSVKYMDTADRLVYQVPSELMLHQKEADAKSEASVNTKA